MLLSKVRDYSKRGDALPIPDLVEVQKTAYERFIQLDKDFDKRDLMLGLESLLREIFPIPSYDESMQLEYLYYKLDPPRYTPDECRQLRLTYGLPFRVGVRLVRKDKPEIPQEEIYLGEIPVLMGGGEFIINGAERVIVSQLHRSPGVDFSIASAEGDRPLHSARIIPERGSWIELEVTKKDVLVMRIDQSTKIPTTTFLRALDEKYSTTQAILRTFYDVQKIKVKDLKPEHFAASPIIDTETGEEIVGKARQVGPAVDKILGSSLKEVEVIVGVDDELILNTIAEESQVDLGVSVTEHEAALLHLYARLRPGNPPQVEKARQLFAEKFFDVNRYRLGKVGRFRINRKFDLDVPESEMALRAEDFLHVIKYILDLRSSRNKAHVDDIDHLGNRRLRTLDELAVEEMRKGFLKLRRTVQERMSVKDPDELAKIADLINSKSISSAIEQFFGRSELSQVVDQTNPLSQLTHERRLSALGPGGLNRKRAGFEVRDVHISHYGRICPIETPEGTNIGLIASLGIYSRIDEYGFLQTPYRDAKNNNKTMYLRADEEMKLTLAPATVFDSTHISEATLSRIMAEEIASAFIETATVGAARATARALQEEIKPELNRNQKVFDDESVSSNLETDEQIDKKAAADARNQKLVWSSDWQSAPASKPGIILFRRQSGQSEPKIVYIGYSSSLYRKLRQHWTTNDSSSFRAGLLQDIREKDRKQYEEGGRLPRGSVLARVDGDLSQVESNGINYIDISPKQIVGVSAALIPFLEHDDANRALMGSNMQRQAVPLIRTEPPCVGTGMEKEVPKYSGMVVRAKNSGTVTYVDSQRIIIDNADEYELRKFVGLNERTCLNQRPIVRLGQKVKASQIIADGAATSQGELALGRNVLVAFNTFDGYNFEDAIVISERLVRDDVFTSIHLEEFDVEIRETKLGREEFTRDIPNVNEKQLGRLDEYGVIRIGSYVRPGDILVGKVSPKSKSELTPEEKLLHAIFGRAGEDVKNDSLEVPAGTEGIVIGAIRFSRRMHLNEEQKRQLKRDMRAYEVQMDERTVELFKQMVEQVNEVTGSDMVDPSTRQKVGASDITEVVMEQIDSFSTKWIKGNKEAKAQAEQIHGQFWPRIEALRKEKERKLAHMKRGDELPSGVLEMVKVYLAMKRPLSVGDKMAGRHGNKGVIARIVPSEEMPFLDDGTPVDVLLNPLGVPSRMNVGQILELHLGWACGVLGFQAVTPVFDGATEDEINHVIREANEYVDKRTVELREKKQSPRPVELLVKMPMGNKVQLYDGRTGEPFDQKTAVGYMYLLKLHHLVDDKIHARATGPYSLITQQPLGGKARTGGQRFGEMEVWALEGYGAAYVLQELLTVKSDDVEGRTKIYESMVKGTNTLEAGMPVAFDVLCNEIKGLGLNITLEKAEIGAGTIL